MCCLCDDIKIYLIGSLYRVVLFHVDLLRNIIFKETIEATIDIVKNLKYTVFQVLIEIAEV